MAMVIIGHGHLSEVGPGDGRSLLSKSNDPFDNILKDSLQNHVLAELYMCFIWVVRSLWVMASWDRSYH